MEARSKQVGLLCARCAVPRGAGGGAGHCRPPRLGLPRLSSQGQRFLSLLFFKAFLASKQCLAHCSCLSDPSTIMEFC